MLYCRIMNELPPDAGIEGRVTEAGETSAIAEVKGGWIAETYDAVLEAISGVPAPIRKNATKALAQLCTSLVDWPAAVLKGKADEARALASSRVRLIEASGERAAELIEAPPEYARIASEKFIKKILRERGNLDEVCKVTVKELASGSALGDETSDEPPSVSPVEEISDEFLNTLETEAAPKSSKEMQLLFGRILAGEIRRPGTFSIRALKKMGEIDGPVAELFQKLCSCAIALKGLESPIPLDARVASLGGNASSNALSQYGLGYRHLNTLHEYGLVVPDYNSHLDYSVSIVNEENVVQAPLLHQGKYWALLSNKKVEKLRIHGVAFSQVGMELFTIVEQSPVPEYTNDLRNFFLERNLKMNRVEIKDKR